MHAMVFTSELDMNTSEVLRLQWKSSQDDIADGNNGYCFLFIMISAEEPLLVYWKHSNDIIWGCGCEDLRTFRVRDPRTRYLRLSEIH